MKITTITEKEFLRLKSNLTNNRSQLFAYGLCEVPIFGREFVVDEKNYLRMSWRNEPFVEYCITDDNGYLWRIPEWLVLDTEEEDGDIDEDHDYYR